MIAELMDRFTESATMWCWFVLLATWRTLPILILVTGVGLALRRKLPPSLCALLLTIVVIRLLTPVSISSPLSLHKPIDIWFSSDSGYSVSRNRPIRPSDHVYGLLPKVDSTDTKLIPVQTQAQPTLEFDFTWDELPYPTFLAIIISASVGLLFRGFFSHLRFALRLRTCRCLEDQPLIDLLLRECDSLAVGRRPALREVPSLTAPAVFGLFRQTICLPTGLAKTLTEQELRWVIRHELAHIRRYDIHVAVIASIASAFHWFNPIVWMIVNRLRDAMETAADRVALQTLSKSDNAAYGELLLRLAEGSAPTKRSPTLGLISFASGKHLKHRFDLLMRDSKPNGFLAKLLSAILVAVIALVGLTDATESTNQKMPEFQLIESDSNDLQVRPLWNDPFVSQDGDGPSFVETYDVDSIFETMPRSLAGSQKTPQEQLTSWLPLSPSLKGKLVVEGQILSADLTARQHQLLKRTLEIWKEGEPKQITIESRFIQTNIQTARSIDWTGGRIDGLTVKGLGPALAACIDESDLELLIRAASEYREGNTFFAPKVTLFDGQTGDVADQVQRPFVTGVDPKADGRMQPVVSIVDEGLRLVLSPKAGENDSTRLEFEVIASSIGKVSFANLPIKASNNLKPQFTVQVPATEQYKVSASVKLATGESVAVAIPRVFSNEPGADAEKILIVVLTPRITIAKKSDRAISERDIEASAD
jgi:beta-lactamase regulating signal transducer with metallopeptidase domain